MKTTALAPMILADEMLSTVAGGHKKHGRRRFPRGLGYGRKLVTNIDVDVDIDVTAGRGSSVDVDVDIDINVGR
jgi:hypothetical protein